jgi:hypothetical protein
MNRPDHISEADWEKMSPRMRKRAYREANPAPARDPKDVRAEQLVIAGGRRWQKNGQDRVYFNDVWIGTPGDDNATCANGYYDVQSGEWICTHRAGIDGETFRAARFGDAFKN